MSNFTRQYLGNSQDKKIKLGCSFTDVLVISKQIELVDYFCNILSQKINSQVYWYTVKENAIICVKNSFVYYAIVAIKKLVIDIFDSMCLKIFDRVLSPIFNDYTKIATFEETDMKELKNWCKRFDINNELIVKTNYTEQLCILSKEPDKFIKIVKIKHLIEPIDHLINFAI